MTKQEERTELRAGIKRGVGLGIGLQVLTLIGAVVIPGWEFYQWQNGLMGFRDLRDSAAQQKAFVQSVLSTAGFFLIACLILYYNTRQKKKESTSWFLMGGGLGLLLGYTAIFVLLFFGAALFIVYRFMTKGWV